MKTKRTTFCALILVVAAICSGIYYGNTAYRAYIAYEKVREDDNAIRESITLNKMRDDDFNNLNTIINTWSLAREGPVDEELKMALRNVGYSDSIIGLVDLWNIPMPAFSFHNLERNRLWAGRAALRGIFPLRGRICYYSDKYFYTVDMKKGYAEVYELRDAGLFFTLYSHRPR